MSHEQPDGFSGPERQTGFDNQLVTDQISAEALNSIIDLELPDHAPSNLELSDAMEQSDIVTPQHLQHSSQHESLEGNLNIENKRCFM